MSSSGVAIAGDQSSFGGPIIIRFDGLDAERHKIELGALGESLKGLSRIIGVAGNFAATQRFVRHRDALAVRVVAREPEHGCFQIHAWIEWVNQNSLFTTVIGGLTVTLVSYIFKSAAGQKEEMRQLRGALDTAIKELGTRDQTIVDRLLTTVDKMAEALLPATRQAVAPIGETVSKLTVSGTDPTSPIAVVGLAEKQAIMSELDAEVGPESTYSIRITELDVETGNCRLALPHDADQRIAGRITDPAGTLPHNPYANALASQRPIFVRAKPIIKDGDIERLYISNTVEAPGT